MKSVIAILTVPLLAGVAAGQQSDIESATARCNQVTQLVTFLSSSKMNVAADVRAAGDACKERMTALQNRDFAKAEQALAHAGTVLDQNNLTAQELYVRLSATVKALSPLQRFYALADLAKSAYNLGHYEDAQLFARELLQDAPQYTKDWNYGNAVYYGNFVLGRLALQQGNARLAGQYLLDAGTTPGSPQLNSFGPNVTLAKELLEKGQAPVVLQFFTECKNFWKMDRGKLDEWSATVRGGGIPEFAQNLAY